MSTRNALLVAIVAALVVAVFFLWPDKARADLAVGAHISGGFGSHDVGGRLHNGSPHFGSLHRGGVQGRLHLGAGDVRRHGSLRPGRGHGRHGMLLGDRFRLDQHRRIGGARVGRGLLGDIHRVEQRRRLNARFLGAEQAHGRHEHKRHARGDGRGDHHRGYGHKRHGHKGHGRWRGRHHAKWLGPAPLLLPYGGADVIVREVVVPVLVPVPAERPGDAVVAPALDPRGRASLVEEEAGVVGDWAVGDILPRDVPHVTLDAFAYGLPQPPSGEKYARVGNDVLRVDLGSRRITAVVAR